MNANTSSHGTWFVKSTQIGSNNFVHRHKHRPRTSFSFSDLFTITFCANKSSFQNHDLFCILMVVANVAFGYISVSWGRGDFIFFCHITQIFPIPFLVVSYYTTPYPILCHMFLAGKGCVSFLSVILHLTVPVPFLVFSY